MRALKIGRLVSTSLTLAIVALLFIPTAAAGTMCSAALEGKVVPNDGCELGGAGNDSTAQVNSDNMFGASDWSLLGKLEFQPDGSTVLEGSLSDSFGNEFTPGDPFGRESGTFSITLASGFEMMIVFKGGEASDPSVYVGYLFESSVSGVTYSTPFSNDQGDTEISHISIYIRGSSTSVPEPATLVLLGTGLVGLGLWRRRRS